jgi:hypothetical protein
VEGYTIYYLDDNRDKWRPVYAAVKLKLLVVGEDHYLAQGSSSLPTEDG